MHRTFRTLIAALLVGWPAVAAAQEFRAVTDRAGFLALVEGRSLTQRLFGVALQVTADGRIAGEAMGGAVTGSWTWQDGFFCREMAWGDRVFDMNCQAVAVGGDLIRFTADQGQGDEATLGLR